MTAPLRDATFPAASRDDWLRRAAAVLKGADVAERLATTTGDGIRIEPLYGRIDGPRAERPVLAPWTVHARVDHPDAVRANTQALDDLGNGVGGLTLVMRDHPSSHGFGLGPDDLARALDGVQLHAAALRLDGGPAAAAAMARLVASQPIDPARLDLAFGLADPAQATALAAQGFRGPFLVADGRPWHARGATEVEELGAVLATAVAHLRQASPGHIGVTLAADQDMFLTLAKFRAMRLLWARVLEAGGLAATPLPLHGETSFRMMARHDPHTNILRACAAVFGAGLGGADSISVLPFSQAQGLPNGFARRVARNVQTILIEESNLWRVSDPASGAGYVEALTEQLCEKAWRVLQRAEAGHWPEPDPQNPRSRPLVGTTAYRLAEEYAAQVEALR